MKIYISGPITGTKDYRERFAEAEEALTAAGHTAVNMARIGEEMPKDSSQAEYMQVSLCMLAMCEGIYMLNGWQGSKGATTEFHYAVNHRQVIYFEQ